MICDDAYITLAHARSWNEGIGPIMSMLNPVCATSTPLHTIILALEAHLFHSQNYPTLVWVNNFFWDLIGFFFLYRISTKGLLLSPPLALLVTAAYAMSVNALAVSAYGMETPMVVALVLAGSWFALYSLQVLPGLMVVSFLAPLARPEGALIPAVLVILEFSKNRKWMRAIVCTFLAVTGFACFFLFYHFAYGRWLPHSIIAKRLEIHIGFIEAMQSWILNVFYKGPSFGGVTAVTILQTLAIVAAGVGYFLKKSFPWKIMVWPFLYFAFYIATHSSYILFTWYYLPVLPFLILLTIKGLAHLIENSKAEKWQWLFVYGLLIYIPVQTFRQHLPSKHRFAEVVREGRYREGAKILDSLANLKKPQLIMIDEVGALGYFGRKIRILDSHGLLSPEALPFLPGKAETYFSRMAAMQENLKPDWILSMRFTKDEGKLYIGEDALYSGYQLKKIIRRPPHGYNFEMWEREADN